jgi:endogenous inhibitor of DNA gyrase (YacG/DUF329 family)
MAAYEECPFCGKDINMDWELTDYIIDGEPPYELECPHCGKLMKVDVDWEPIYFVQIPPQPKQQG